MVYVGAYFICLFYISTDIPAVTDLMGGASFCTSRNDTQCISIDNRTMANDTVMNTNETTALELPTYDSNILGLLAVSNNLFVKFNLIFSF